MIEEKRNSLERFLREQLIGPGGCNNQFRIVQGNEVEQDDDLINGEVVSTTPGSIYSSAILFPQQTIVDGHIPEDDNNEDDEDETDSDQEENSDTEISDIDYSEDIDALGRRFPNRFGVSCCLSGNINDNLHIKISGRYYCKIENKRSIQIRLINPDDFEAFMNNQEYQRLIGNLVEIDGEYLRITRTINNNDLQNNKENLRELNRYLCNRVAHNPDDTIDPIYNEVGENYRFLSAYKEKLFEKLTRVRENGNYDAAGQENTIKERIAQVEKYETCISYIEDVISIFDSRDFGFWQAYNFEREISLDGIDLTSRRIFKADDYPALQNIIRHQVREGVYLSLDAWLQVLRENNRYYLKVLLVNSSTPVLSSEVKFYSIVTEKVNERCFFGMKVDISSPNLVEYHRENNYETNDDEVNYLRFLYRNIKDYGVGHLCSVDWKIEEDGLLHVFSEFLPSYETPDVETVPRMKTREVAEDHGRVVPQPYLNDTSFLRFKELSVFSDKTDVEIKEGLLEFIEKYNEWINCLPIENDYARNNIEKCRNDYYRIRHNIEDFLNDPHKMLAFRLMNAAMFMQLWHKPKNNKASVRENRVVLDFNYYRDYADDTSIYNGVHAAWRPFQLAFILLNLDGIFQRHPDQEWTERNELVDLVWFPTGGGKTEAYLGIIALTIINRRQLFGTSGYGTAAIMRYTLRLLTTQQFQRALRLIMALEQIRLWGNNDYNLGDSEISIGLYVGSNSLPNTNDDLVDEVRNWSNTHGRVPLDTCPWCGSEISLITVNREQHFRCSNLRCTFGGRNRYPVRLCDEHIYKNPPTFLLGTVDKFAQLAHKVDIDPGKDSRRIFNSNGCIPPDLIIQDELHLLLGPLGSAVALYENAIDQLCTRVDAHGYTIRPKIISSTATTRNTSLQIRALYDRDVSIFPKSGVDYDDSFFAFYQRYKEDEDTNWKYVSKRKYLGVLPTGRTQMTTQIRLAAILFVHRAIFELEHIDSLNDEDFIKAADYYYSVISYFNSLKEVGKTDAQFYQEFSKYTRRLYKRVLRYSNLLECFYAYNSHFRKSELTGRLSGKEAIAALKTAEKLSWDPNRRLPFQEGEDGELIWKRAELPADMILATNMISVGLDVSRFNTIIMNSMPRNIAEYIQASSRVAREKKGLVLTLHNPFNQRDVSHFEKFREFHEKLYYYVEPISITPFSPKSVTRFLPLYLAAIIRHTHNNVSGRTDASRMDQQLADQLKAELRTYFDNRMERTSHTIENALLTAEMLQVVYQEIDRNIDIWLNECVNARNNQNQLVYKERPFPVPQEIPLFASPEDFEGDIPLDKWLVPNALRVIEPESVIHVIR